SNQIESLPDTIDQAQFLMYLDVSNNKLSKLPSTIWKLKKLEHIIFEGNPWDEEFQDLKERGIPEILDYLRKKTTVSVFLSHAVIDYEYFQIDKISEYFVEDANIYNAFYCERDLRGDIDNFMNETMPECHILIFFGTQKSFYNSPDCAHELDLANKYNIPIIPIKGRGVELEALKSKFGTNDIFEFENLNEDFLERLKRYVFSLFSEKTSMERDDIRFQKMRESILKTILAYVKSPEYKSHVAKHYHEFEERFIQMSNNQISTIEYCLSCFEGNNDYLLNTNQDEEGSEEYE
ncbi:MAG: hypothetical protein ACFE8P_04620, partial [Promethearchaeota archaeon]